MTDRIPILVSIDANEVRHPRAERIVNAINEDDGFLLWNIGNLSHDLRFRLDNKALNVEIKDFTGDHQSDYVTSIISPEGRLYHQVLSGRELQEPLVIIVLGGDADVATAIAKSVFSRGFCGMDAVDKILEYTQMIDDFEASCEGCNIRIWRLKDNPYRRMLLRVRKILEGGDLSTFQPSPADGEKRLAGLSMLIGNGIGPARSEGILEKFNIVLEPKEPGTYLSDCRGIGPKLAAIIQEALNLDQDVAIRPNKKKIRRITEDNGP